jgi:DNA-binding protein H-NS
MKKIFKEVTYQLGQIREFLTERQITPEENHNTGAIAMDDGTTNYEKHS